MDTKQRETFETRWLADLDAYYAELHKELERDHQKAREDVKRIWSGDGNQAGGPVSFPSTAVTQQARNGTQTANGLPEGVTRRAAVWEIISELGNQPFTQPQIKEIFLERYPNADTPNLRPGISGILKEETDKGNLEMFRKAEQPSEPHVYRVQQKTREGNLLDS